MFQIIQTINHRTMTLAKFDNLANAERFLVKYRTVLIKRDPHLKFTGTTIITNKPVCRKIEIKEKRK